MTMTGLCLCGSVAFEFDLPITDIEICHCSRYQGATGSPFAAEFRVRADKFRWLRGKELISFCDAPVTSRTSGVSQVVLQNQRFPAPLRLCRTSNRANPHGARRRRDSCAGSETHLGEQESQLAKSPRDRKATGIRSRIKLPTSIRPGDFS